MLFTEQLEVSITKEPPRLPHIFPEKLIFLLKKKLTLHFFLHFSCTFRGVKKSPMQSSVEPWKTFNHRYHRFAAVKKNPADKPGWLIQKAWSFKIQLSNFPYKFCFLQLTTDQLPNLTFILHPIVTKFLIVTRACNHIFIQDAFCRIIGIMRQYRLSQFTIFIGNQRFIIEPRGEITHFSSPFIKFSI